jgi:hypothetical protein
MQGLYYPEIICHDPAMKTTEQLRLRVVPVSFREACAFIADHHRHNKPPRGMKFAIGLHANGELAGVVTAGRPVSRAYDPREVVEINRTCTDGAPNANSMLYGAARRAAAAMGYNRIITYTQADETGTSLRAAGFRRDAELAARGSWAESSVKLREIRDPEGNGGVARIRWTWP